MKLKLTKGFSVVEMLVVILFVGILVTVSVRVGFRTDDRSKLKQSAREITNSIFRMKQHAVTNNTTVRLFFRNDQTYKLYYHSTDPNDVGKFSPDRWPWMPVSENTLSDGDVGTQLLVKDEPASSGNFPDFAINSRGMIIDPNTMMLATAQEIRLEPRFSKTPDYLTITVFPFGAIEVFEQWRYEDD